MIRRPALLMTVLLAALLGYALLAVEPDPSALRARGLEQLLQASGDTPPLLEEVARVAEGAPVLWLQTRLPTPAMQRAVASALAVANAERASALSLDGPDGSPPAGAALLELRLIERERDLFLDARVQRRGLQVELERRGPWRMPGRSALLPPLLAIAVALAFRRTISALLCGIFVGTVLLRVEQGSGWLAAPLLGLLDLFWVYLRGELLDSFRIEVIGFVIALISMVGVMGRAGGVQGMVDWIVRFAHSVRSTLAVAFGMGCMIFFDDYSNCLIVGTTMRPLSDRLRISREKLAYVVDSTAAPVAGLSLLSTWIAFEVSTFAPYLPAAGIAENPYAVFLQSLPFRYYCLFTLGFVILNVLVGRDFGPMREAERRARATGQVVRAGGQPLVSQEITGIEASPGVVPRARNALLPVAAVIGVTVHEIFRGGGGYGVVGSAPERLLTLSGWTDVLIEGGGAGPLFSGAFAGLCLALFLSGSNLVRISLLAGLGAAALFSPALAQLLAPVLPTGMDVYAAAGIGLASGFGLSALLLGWASRPATTRAHLAGFEQARAALASTRALGFAVVLLFCAWMIGQVCEDIRTADYLVALSSDVVTALWLPVILFGVACAVSFATGTSWGTMSILLPNVIALAAALGAEHPIGSFGLVLVCIGAVLEGSIFGDHCSPISDTTILSSVSTASDHIDHVRTQVPYALVAAGTAVGAGYLPTLLFSWWSLPLALGSGYSLWLALLWLLGRPVPE